jgi:hypothetical protein
MSSEEAYCNHDPAAVNDEGVCECGQAVEGPALDALVLDQIAGYLAAPDWSADTLMEIDRLVRWTGRNGGPEPHEHYDMRAYEAGGSDPRAPQDEAQP